MADNWSSSVLTLANAGDWCKWAFDVPDSTAAADLNGAAAGTHEDFQLRGALGGASRTTFLAVMINDSLAKYMVMTPPSAPPDQIDSSAGWVSADRFGQILYYAIQGFGTCDFPAGGDSKVISTAAPFFVGTNTLRVIHFGTEAVEIDFMQMFTALGGGLAGGLGDDSHAESVPGTFAGHVNPDSLSGLSGHTWLLKAPDATTGTAAESTIELLKFCDAGAGTVARIRVTGSGTPLAGTVGFWPDGIIETLDGSGRADFVLSGTTGGQFWYGGSDNFAPKVLDVAGGTHIGCGGWIVGEIGMG